MEKLDKVIAGLTQCYYGKCSNCPYEFSGDMSCHDAVNQDALELLRGHKELETAYSKLFDRNKESEYELEDMRRRASDYERKALHARSERDEAWKKIALLEGKYNAAVEAAAIATELAAKYRSTDGDLIRRSDVLKYPLRRDTCDKKNANPHFINGVESVMEYVETLTSVEAELVVHAHWRYDDDESKFFCSSCNEEAHSYKDGETTCSFLSDRCPYCGAHMDEEVAE